MRLLGRVARMLPLALLSPVVVALAWPALWLVDVAWVLFGRRKRVEDRRADATAATVVIPNWNGRDLLEKYLPTVVEALKGNPRNEVLVVENGSTDGSAEFLRTHFPTVRVLELKENLGFGGGSNAGFAAAKNDIVVLLNSDMRVAKDFLEPLLRGFTDERVFAVTCQIFFSDPARVREETGLTQAWWQYGGLRVRHYDDGQVDRAFPCFYGGGGSTAYDRKKFLELGGFDHLLAPFYLEDTDIGFMAWKRGWKVLYEPASHVWHEHRGTIGKKFSRAYIDGVVAKNFILFSWKNIHEPLRLAGHFFFSWAGALLGIVTGDAPQRPSLAGLARAFVQLPGAMAARWRARCLAVVEDTEAFRRPMGAYFRDRFEEFEREPERLSVLFVSPYAICPPIHGGGVFMYECVRQLGRHTDLHVVAMLDDPKEQQAHAAILDCTKSLEFLIRLEGQPKGIGAITPFAIREFRDAELEWLIHRQVYLKKVDVVQLEYTQLGQYAGPTKQLKWALFEHDVYFQSVARLLPRLGVLSRPKAFLEYLRALRYELRMLPKFDMVQTCTAENTACLLEYLPELEEKVRHDLRAGIDAEQYEFRTEGRRAKSILFLGSFRHLPNQTALKWLLYKVMPRVLELEPEARLTVIGSDPPAVHTIPTFDGAVELVGFVDDIRQPLGEHAVFVCPILSGSGVRVKLLEAFAAGIPTVSTRIGAEGLGETDGEYCALADDPREFAEKICALLGDEAAAGEMAKRARRFVETERGIGAMTERLVEAYRGGKK